MGIEQNERKVESELEKVESTTERIEREIGECEKRIQRLEADIRAARSKEDGVAVAAMELSLAGQKAERQRIEKEADQIIQQLQGLQRDIKGVDSWNTELQDIVAAQAALGIETGDIERRVADRARWVEEQWDRVLELLQRIGHIRT